MELAHLPGYSSAQMEVWGITGVIGSGKSTAVRYLSGLGFPVVDADEISRRVVDRSTEEGKEGFEKVYKAFGPSVLDSLGNLDRRALRKRMMLNPQDRDTLEALLHPLILKSIERIMRQWKQEDRTMGFIEGARLVESGFHNVLAGVILVTASPPTRVKRIMKRDGMAKMEVEMMFGLQDESFMKRASKVVWNNDKTEKNLQQQIDQFLISKGVMK